MGIHRWHGKGHAPLELCTSLSLQTPSCSDSSQPPLALPSPQNEDRFTTFICSKGKQEYLQLLWTFLDPDGELMPRSRWTTHMTSTFPDVLPAAAPKTALSALGCASVLQPHVATQLAAPVVDHLDREHREGHPDQAEADPFDRAVRSARACGRVRRPSPGRRALLAK